MKTLNFTNFFIFRYLLLSEEYFVYQINRGGRLSLLFLLKIISFIAAVAAGLVIAILLWLIVGRFFFFSLLSNILKEILNIVKGQTQKHI